MSTWLYTLARSFCIKKRRRRVRARVAPLLGVPSEAAIAAPGTCPDVLTLFSQHLEDEISPDVCGEMERHLAACGRCRGASDSLKRTLALCRAAGPGGAGAPVGPASVKVALRGFLAEKGA